MAFAARIMMKTKFRENSAMSDMHIAETVSDDDDDDDDDLISSEWELSMITPNALSDWNPFSCNLQTGTLIFRTGLVETAPKPCMIVNINTFIQDIARWMIHEWHLVPPKVILNIINNPNYFTGFQDISVEEDFQLGIIEAAKLTKMWILSSGVNDGLCAIIGEAAGQEVQRRQMLQSTMGKGNNNTLQFSCFAFTNVNDLSYGMQICDKLNTDAPTLIENSGINNQELNPDFTHYFLMKGDDKDVANILRNLVTKMTEGLNDRKRRKSSDRFASSSSKQSDANANCQASSVGLADSKTVANVSILYQGGPKEIDQVLWQLKNKIPVMVIQTEGMASGLISYALSERFKGGSIQHLQTVKADLMSMVTDAFPDDFADNELARNQCRDKILECVKFAIQNDSIYLTVMDLNQTDVDVKDLRKSLLDAIFLSQPDKKDSRWNYMMNWILHLALEWDSPDFVVNHFIDTVDRSRFKIHNNLFAASLLIPYRAEFVDLFLGMGFELHKFLTLPRLQQLYEKSLGNEFFTVVILRGILGKSSPVVGTGFLSYKATGDLNKILYNLTNVSQLFKPENLSKDVPKTHDEFLAHQKQALLALIYWAVLNNKKDLTKVLWQLSHEPMTVGLVVANMFYRLSKYWITDVDLQMRIKEHSREFSNLAIQIMNLTYNDSKILAFRALKTPIKDFNKLTIVDLAFIGRNKYFISHPCCQRSLRERWSPRFYMRNSTIFGFALSNNIMLLLCLFLVFPIYFWIHFNPEKRKLDAKENSRNTSSTVSSIITNALTGHGHYGEYRVSQTEGTKDAQQDLFAPPPLWKKLRYLWTSPMTKFWLNQIFFLIYLGLYAYALLLPYCGNVILNDLLAVWTLIMLIEDSRPLIVRKSKFRHSGVFSSLFRILTDLFNLVTMCCLSLDGHQVVPYKINFMTFKALRALGFIGYCYITMSSVFPVSPTLGPMLVNVEKLIKYDFVQWFSMWFFLIVAGGLAIQMIIYPLKSLDIDMLASALLRALLGIFLTDVSDLKGTNNCTSPLGSIIDLGNYSFPENTTGLLTTSNYMNNISINNTLGTSLVITTTPHFFQSTVIQPNTCDANSLSKGKDCPHSTPYAYSFVVYYLMITRLVIYVLMYAIFSGTIARTRQKSVEIWKYQFYLLVVHYEEVGLMPVPLTALTYPYRFLRWLQGSNCCSKAHLSEEAVNSISYNQWKTYLTTLSRREDEERLKKTQFSDTLAFLEYEISAQKLQAKQLNDKFIQMETNQAHIGMIIQRYLHTLDAMESKRQPQKIHTDLQRIHTASRHPTYPQTDLTRFPLFDRDIPWDVELESYDPVIYSKPVDEFDPGVQVWVDVDPLRDDSKSVIDDMKGKSNFFQPKYNEENWLRNSDNASLMINRKSCMSRNGKPVKYELDSTGLPMNPCGRTGLRGRGALLFWGPNHFIQAVISRLAVDESPNSSTKTAGAKTITFLTLVDDENPGVLRLPGAQVTPNVSIYSKLCETFLREVRKDEDTVVPSRFKLQDLVDFFSAYSMSELSRDKKSGSVSRFGFFPNLVFRGYVDNQFNTDNAWKETEIWSFHYKYDDSLLRSISDTSHIKWVPLSQNMGLPKMEFEAVIEAGKVNDYHL